jgi:hypothetical protein
VTVKECQSLRIKKPRMCMRGFDELIYFAVLYSARPNRVSASVQFTMFHQAAM